MHFEDFPYPSRHSIQIDIGDKDFLCSTDNLIEINVTSFKKVMYVRIS